jgi:phage terminase large subunit
VSRRARIAESPATLDGVKKIELPAGYEFLFEPHRYKVAHGGRGSSKSWSFARALILIAIQRPLRVLCARELQTSIGESVHRLICDQIHEMGFDNNFNIQKTLITGPNGSEFIFAGIRNNVTKIKSMEGIDVCWVEEAEVISTYSWEVLIPTIRKPGSEIWITFNPDQETDPTYVRFITNQPPDCVTVEVNWTQNPWFPEELRVEKDYLYKLDIDAAEHVWGGKCRVNGAAQIFKGKYVKEDFKTPDDPSPRFFHGVDWGFSGDPCAIVRCYTTGDAPFEDLWIDRERVAYGVEIDEIPKLLREIPTTDKWPIKADSSRPETISYIKRQGFNIVGAEKWGGSVEDGIAHLKAFNKIHIHPSCTHMLEEARLYSYKVDRVTQEVLPIVADKHNHCWDATRYALDGYIHKRGSDKMWAKLAGK